MSIASCVVELDSLEVDSLTRDEIIAAFASLAQVRAWHDVVHAQVTRRLQRIAEQSPSVLAEHDIAAASKTSRREADQAARRAVTLGTVAEMEAALSAGDVSASHVDCLGRALKELGSEQRESLAAAGDRLVRIASHSTPEQFDKALKIEIHRLNHAEGTDRLRRQRRANRLRSWTDRDTGMVCLRGEFDPEAGLRLLGKIDNAVDSLFHSKVPDTCPEGEGKHDHLRALALIHLTNRQPAAAKSASGTKAAEDDCPHCGGQAYDITRYDNRCEISITIDLDTIVNGPHAKSVVDNGFDADIPIESYRRWACTAALIPMVLSSDGVVMDQGREVRLANRVQRRALKAMYKTCAVPGCRVASRHCEPHHIQWWRNGGRTDLCNLVPLCSRHHHAVHEGGWKLTLHPNRGLTITYPDGVIRTTGPPIRQREA